MKKISPPPPPAASDDDDIELLKAVAQAWHAQSGNPRAAASSDDGGGVSGGRRAGGGGSRHRPSRFKLEAAAAARGGEGRGWDFARSLWDTYELVAVARKLESGLVLADEHPGAAASTPGGGGGGVKRVRESSRSLRSMFLRSSSRRCKASQTQNKSWNNQNTSIIQCLIAKHMNGTTTGFFCAAYSIPQLRRKPEGRFTSEPLNWGWSKMHHQKDNEQLARRRR